LFVCLFFQFVCFNVFPSLFWRCRFLTCRAWTTWVAYCVRPRDILWSLRERRRCGERWVVLFLSQF
jgi:hypothetical protein